MELKPEIVKTIKRLSLQSKNDVLKNKLREWILAKDFTLDDLLYNCVEGNISLSGALLNKMGSLYSLGQEGMTEDTDAAFALFEIAAELGHATANGNCAQYFFDGRAPEGKNIELAYIFCRKAIELGADKYMLLGEILYDQNQYAEAVNCVHNILDKAGQERKKRTEARDMERQCLLKVLNRVFYKLNTYNDAAPTSNGLQMLNTTLPLSPSPQPGFPSPTRSSASFFSSPRALRSPRTALFASAAGADSVRKGKAPTPRLSTSAVTDSFQRMQINTTAQDNTQTGGDRVSGAELPGWVNISEDIDGFDRNACTELTARAELLELEAHALRAAWETAHEHVTHARRNNMSEDILRLLTDSKVQDFKRQYENVLANKNMHIDCWDAYADTQEHIIRRQLITEQAFFCPRSTSSTMTLQLAETLLRRRTKENSPAAAEPLVLNMVADPAFREGRIPSGRRLLTAEKALLDVAAATYEPRTYTTSERVEASGTTGADADGAAKEKFSRSMLLYTGWTSDGAHSSAGSGAASGASDGSGAARTGSPQRAAMASSNLSSPNGRATAGSGTASPMRQSVPSMPVTLKKEPPAAYTYPEVLMLDGSPLRYRLRTTIPLIPTDSNIHQSGFSIEEVPCSNEVLSFLNKVTMVAEDPVYIENEKILARMILRFTHDGAPFTLEELQCLNPELIHEDKVHMDRICYHYFVKRVVKWLVSAREENTHLLLPIASIQARTLQLLEMGIITLQEAFDQDGLYGVFYSDERSNVSHIHYSLDAHSGGHHHYPHFKNHNHNHLTSTLQNKNGAGGGILSLHHTTSSKHVPPLLALRNKVKHINALYQKYVVELQQQNFLPTIQYWKQHTTGATVPTHRLLYTELARCYGGESDDATDLGAVAAQMLSRDTAMHVLLQKLQS